MGRASSWVPASRETLAPEDALAAAVEVSADAVGASARGCPQRALEGHVPPATRGRSRWRKRNRQTRTTSTSLSSSWSCTTSSSRTSPWRQKKGRNLKRAQDTLSRFHAEYQAYKEEQAKRSVVSGTVKDANTNSGILGATVAIQSQGLTAITDDLGDFRFRKVNVGEVVVTAEAQGYATYESSAFISEGVNSHMSIKMVQPSVKEQWGSMLAAFPPPPLSGYLPGAPKETWGSRLAAFPPPPPPDLAPALAEDQPLEEGGTRKDVTSVIEQRVSDY